MSVDPQSPGTPQPPEGAQAPESAPSPADPSGQTQPYPPAGPPPAGPPPEAVTQPYTPAYPPPAGYPPPPPGEPVGYPPAGPYPGQEYPPASYPYAPVAAAPPTDDKAVWALVTAIAGWVICPVILHIVGWVLANQSLATIRASGGTVGGEGMAKAARVLAIVGLVLYGVVILFLLLIGVVGLIAAVDTGEFAQLAWAARG